MLKRSLLLSVLTLTLALVGFSMVMADGPVEGRAGRAELRFMEGMIDHHQMAIDMANDCLVKATTESVLATCQNVITAQTAEIMTMQDWLLNWYNVAYSPIPMASEMEVMGDEMDMNGMATAEPVLTSPNSTAEAVVPTAAPVPDSAMPDTDPAMMMGMFAGLGRLEGVEYEIAWLEAMIDHHDDAIHMSERVLESSPEGTGHAELRELAQKIITDQMVEIEHLETMLTELAG